jgi:hypothetical protein
VYSLPSQSLQIYKMCLCFTPDMHSNDKRIAKDIYGKK